MSICNIIQLLFTTEIGLDRAFDQVLGRRIRGNFLVVTYM